jgi:hypothetical protein
MPSAPNTQTPTTAQSGTSTGPSNLSVNVASPGIGGLGPTTADVVKTKSLPGSSEAQVLPRGANADRRDLSLCRHRHIWQEHQELLTSADEVDSHGVSPPYVAPASNRSTHKVAVTTGPRWASHATLPKLHSWSPMLVGHVTQVTGGLNAATAAGPPSGR